MSFQKHTLDGMEMDKTDSNGGLSQKVFGHHLRSHLPSLQPLLQQTLEQHFTAEVDSKQKRNGELLPYIYTLELQQKMIMTY